MVQVGIHPVGTGNHYLYVVIVSKYRGKYIWVQHKARSTWEIPGGHIESGETPDDAAKRELMEETGAMKFIIKPVCDYSVKIDDKEGISRLYIANIEELGPLPESEIRRIDFFDNMPSELTYPAIQPILFAEVLNNIKDKVQKSK